MNLASLAYGTSTFAREVDSPQAHRLLDNAFSRGIRMFDTAATYSAGNSELILGDWIRQRAELRSQLTIATKMYPPFTADAIEKAWAEASDRLGLEVIDLFYLHKWDETAATMEAVEALHRLVVTGRVRQIGACNFTAAQLRHVLRIQANHGYTVFHWLQNNHNFAVREAGDDERRVCKEAGIKLVTYSPLGAGFLLGKHRLGVEVGSRFALSPGHKEIYFLPECWQRLERLEAVAAEVGSSPALLALAWAMSRAGTDVVLVGARTCEQLDQAFEARALVGTPALAKLDAD
jgi:aryl-alcohol dehydrogenase-like predicted oxidoreductase